MIVKSYEPTGKFSWDACSAKLAQPSAVMPVAAMLRIGSADAERTRGATVSDSDVASVRSRPTPDSDTTFRPNEQDLRASRVSTLCVLGLVRSWTIGTSRRCGFVKRAAHQETPS